MQKMSYKQKYEELKAKTDVDKKISQHTKNYIHIAFSWGGVWRFFNLLLSTGLCIGYSFVFYSNWIILNISELFKAEEEINQSLVGYYQLGIIPDMILAYVMIGWVFICLTALIKGGFKKINDWYDKDGLIGGLIVGLIGGLIVGLIVGLIGGLIVGLIVGLIGGLIVGLIGGLIVGLIGGLIVGLIGEFEG